MEHIFNPLPPLYVDVRKRNSKHNLWFALFKGMRSLTLQMGVKHLSVSPKRLHIQFHHHFFRQTVCNKYIS
jgi:hypothetical protein